MATETSRRDTMHWRRARVRVVGKVQGVSFRAYAADNATSLDLSGWVRNEADGSVTLEVEGHESKVDAMIEWCRQGSPEARVADVVVLKMTPNYKRTPFVIER